VNKYPDGEFRACKLSGRGSSLRLADPAPGLPDRDDAVDMVVGAISRVDPRDMAVQTNSTSSSCQPVLSTVRPSRSWMRSPAGR
jgi:hypothetical protein